MVRLKREKNTSAPERDRGELLMTRGARITSEITAIGIVALIVLAIIYRHEITVENIVNFSPANLWLAALVFIALYAVKSLTVVVYVKLLNVAAGLVFPLPAAIAVNIIGTCVQLTLPYMLGRIGGRGAADFIVKRRPKLGRLAALRNRSNFWFSAFVRAVGLFPADPVSIYFGACGMPFPAFLMGSTVGLLPTMIVSTVVGTAADDPGSPEFIISAVLFIGLQLAAAIAFWLWIRKNNTAIAVAGKESHPNESTQ